MGNVIMESIYQAFDFVHAIFIEIGYGALPLTLLK